MEDTLNGENDEGNSQQEQYNEMVQLRMNLRKQDSLHFHAGQKGRLMHGDIPTDFLKNHQK